MKQEEEEVYTEEEGKIRRNLTYSAGASPSPQTLLPGTIYSVFPPSSYLHCTIKGGIEKHETVSRRGENQ